MFTSLVHERPLQGLAKSMYNVGLAYDTKIISASVNYQYTGLKIVFAGFDGPVYDLYQTPFGSLNAQVSVHLMEGKMGIKMRVNNILDPIISLYANYNSVDMVARSEKEKDAWLNNLTNADKKAHLEEYGSTDHYMNYLHQKQDFNMINSFLDDRDHVFREWHNGRTLSLSVSYNF